MKNLAPKVSLISFSGVHDAYLAALNCTNSDPISDMMLVQTDEAKIEKLLNNVVILNGHESIAEFITFTFAIEGINLATSHQYVRHRLQNIAQKSQRYITHKELVTSLPRILEGIVEVHAHFEESWSLYNKLIESGVKAEDARLVLPQAVSTSLVCKLNARELIHVIGERECTCAQHQIREVATKMHGLAREVCPFIFDHVGPKCYELGYCPEKRNGNGCQIFKKSPHYV